jgi:hypothetical protein
MTLKIVVGIVLCSTLAISLLALAVFLIFRGSGATRLAAETAQADPVVVQRIGAPLNVIWAFGDLDDENGSGKASLDIAISGPNGRGKLFVDEVKFDGVWKIETLYFGFVGQPLRQIVPAPPPP